MSKRKRKNDQPDLMQQLEECGVVIIRLIAGFLMLILVGVMLILVYLKFLYPGFEISVWMTMTALFTYLSGYLAFTYTPEESDSDEDDEKRKNDWFDDEE